MTTVLDLPIPVDVDYVTFFWLRTAIWLMADILGICLGIVGVVLLVRTRENVFVWFVLGQSFFLGHTSQMYWGDNDKAIDVLFNGLSVNVAVLCLSVSCLLQHRKKASTLAKKDTPEADEQ